MGLLMMRSLLILLVVFPLWAWAGTAFVAVPDQLNGQPIANSSERIAKQVKITQVGGQFLWQSNGNVPLARIFKGDKIIFVAAGGDGMVVILNQSGVPQEARQGDKRPFLYCEHMRAGLAVDSYCGGSQEVAVEAP